MGERRRFAGVFGGIVAAAAASLALAAPVGAFEPVFAGGFDGGQIGVGARVNGGLSEIGTSPFDTGASGIEGLAVAPDRSTLFAVDNSGALLSASISRRNALALTGPSQPTGLFPYGVATTPNGKYVYASGGLPPDVFGFRVAGDGALTPIAQDPIPLDAPTGLAVSPNGKYLFAATETSEGDIHTFKIAGSGALTEISGSPATGASSAFAVVIAPNGKTLYAGNRGVSAVNAFKVGGSGALTELAGSPYAAGGDNPFGLAVSPNGKQVYAALYDSGKVAAFDVGAGGKLAAQAGSPYPAPNGVSAISLDPAGDLLYEQTAAAATPIRIAELTHGVPGAAAPITFTAQGDFQSIVPGPAQPPKAVLKIPKKAEAGKLVKLSAADSRDRNSIIEFRWNFGDGKRATETEHDETTHKFKKPGKYKVTVTETDETGCSTKFVFTGQTAYCNGSKQAKTSETIKVTK